MEQGNKDFKKEGKLVEGVGALKGVRTYKQNSTIVPLTIK